MRPVPSGRASSGGTDQPEERPIFPHLVDTDADPYRPLCLSTFPFLQEIRQGRLSKLWTLKWDGALVGNGWASDGEAAGRWVDGDDCMDDSCGYRAGAVGTDRPVPPSCRA